MANLLNVRRVLAVGAHPDDIELLGGGTLAKYRLEGVEVAMAVATDGSGGHMEIGTEQLVQIRRKEAQASAGIIGAELYWLGLPDAHLFEDLERRMQFVELIRSARPDVILTHDPHDYHPDHRAVSRLVFDASFLSSLPNLETEHPAHPGVQPLIYFDTLAGARTSPDDFVDIGETYTTKKQMMACFESQLQWVKFHDDVDMMEYIDVTGRARGLQCGVKYAEGFVYERSWPRRRASRLLP